MSTPNREDLGGQIVVLEIPHRGEARAWSCFGADAFVAAVQADAPVVLHFRIDSRQMVDMFEPEDELPEGLGDIFGRHDHAVGCYDPTRDGAVYYAPGAEPSEFEVAQEYLAHDLQALRILTVEEAREWAHEWPVIENALISAGATPETPGYEADLLRRAAEGAWIRRNLEESESQTNETIQALDRAINRRR